MTQTSICDTNPDLSYYNINPELALKIKEHGFRFEVSVDSDAWSPREHVESVFVGGEVAIPHNVDRGTNFEEFVENYCRDILSCEVNDIIWIPVFSYTHSGTAYSTVPFKDRWDSGRAGFIYETKENIRSEFGVKEIDEAVESIVKSRLGDEVKTYDQWANSRVYSLSLSSANEVFTESCGGAYEDCFDETVESLISSLIKSIDKDKWSCLVEMEIGELEDGDTAASRINEVLINQFDTALSFGTLKQTEAGTLAATLAFKDLPSFWHLAEASSIGLFGVVMHKAAELEPTKERFQHMQEISYHTKYGNWSETSIKALIFTLFDDIDIAHVVNISEVSLPTA